MKILKIIASPGLSAIFAGSRLLLTTLLPRIISHPHPARNLHFLLSPPRQVEVEYLAKPITDNSSSDVEDIGTKINQGTKFGTLLKPKFCLFDVIIFLFNGIIKQNIEGTVSSEQNLKYRL